MGLSFEVVSPGGDGPEIEGDPSERVLAHARWKAEKVRSVMGDYVVLAADTLVFLDGRALGKPIDSASARGMLESLFDRVHEVWTGIFLVGPDGKNAEAACCASVNFPRPEEEDLILYLEGREWADKAGGYGIQGWAGRWATVVEGEMETVIGLPSKVVRELMTKLALAP